MVTKVSDTGEFPSLDALPRLDRHGSRGGLCDRPVPGLPRARERLPAPEAGRLRRQAARRRDDPPQLRPSPVSLAGRSLHPPRTGSARRGPLGGAEGVGGEHLPGRPSSGFEAEHCWDALVPHLSSDQAIEIHYEDLVLRTESVLAEICRFMGVEYSAEMLDYQVDAPQYPPPDPTLVAQWKTKLAPRDVALVELRTGRPDGEPRVRPERSSTPDDRPAEARAAPDGRPAAKRSYAGSTCSARGWSRSTCSAAGSACDAWRRHAQTAHQRGRAEPDRSGGGRERAPRPPTSLRSGAREEDRD